MIRGILPAPVASAEVFRDLPHAVLFPGEEAAIRGAPEARRTEFRTVRHCARTALGELGLAPVPILPGPRREPQWPEGIVGSMTHCAGYRAAAVARAGDIASLGIDAEPHEALPDGMLPAVARPEEVDRLAGLYVRRPEVHWDRLTFSAKESVYKAWFPLARRWLGFHDASLTLHPDRRTFDVSLHDNRLPLGGRSLTTLSGRWTVEDGLIATCVVVDAAAAAA
ncbi:4'-phosphopantetheinyl transferase superfamily protein [Streptomyces piniterrae]|uniref:4'-phosphopantetheinyl transferase superfamily protein n=1 Tax=Streptomyces piniterrae TaxID=2571125 RepID=A0A4U0NS55_9ACTN|nr:4'-phosphopantetheinyl transferase superfamily protein [Streptomyces piniterrae]TJZ57353.1 4'-phosphopantetheinyl transferase superfamily protein [Streptomyces piniterrae]